MKNVIATHFAKSQAALDTAVRDAAFVGVVQTMADAIAGAIANGHKLLIVGNGGSAADAQHIAAEIIGRYKQERSAYAAIALTTDTSVLTAIGNDYDYEKVFVRQVHGLAQAGDVLMAITTSGRSKNVLAALGAARDRGLVTIGLTGSRGESMRALCDHLLVVPSDDTAVIQQVYMTAAHAICDDVEHALVARAK